MLAVIAVVQAALNLLWYIIIASAVLSWLYAFNIVNAGNQFVDAVGNFLYRVTEPIYRPIRRILPNLGGLDLSPLVVLFAILFLQVFIANYVERWVIAAGI